MEFLEFCAAMWPDDECIVHISDPHLWPKYMVVFKALSSRYSMKRLAMTGESWDPIAVPSNC